MSIGRYQGQNALEVRDRQGRLVRYSKTNYERHLIKHPEMADLIADIEHTIADPDIEIDADNRHVYLYRRGMGTGRLSELWLFVVVLYFGSGQDAEGVVKTSYFTSKIAKDGRLIWKR